VVRPANPAIFREYDIRGVAEQDFDAAFARTLGQAYGTMAREAGKRVVAVGRDCRLTSPTYASALAEGLVSTGLEVVDIGTCPTPLMYFSLFHFDLDGGIQVTGSHNPPDFNGFKICLDKSTIYGEQIQELRQRIARGGFATGRGQRTAREIIAPYQDHLAGQFGRLPRNLTVVVDAGNSTAGPVAPPLFERLGCTVIRLFCDMDGRFPNHHPDPTVVENMQALIERVRSPRPAAMSIARATELDAGRDVDMGIAFDGDADRIGVVDRSGRIIWGDEMLVLFARDVLARHPGAVIVSEVKCSQRLYDDIAARGGRGIMWKAGHSLLKAKMKETGGEMSGHMFFADRYFGYDDAIYAACRLLEIVAREGRSVDALLADLPAACTTPEIRVDCPEDKKFQVAERAREYFRARHEIIDVDGVRIRVPHGWGLIRASNTQPVLVLRFEARSQADLETYRRLVEDVVAAIRRELGA
jgi:phosphomannomutase/phosphoglucomutase